MLGWTVYTKNETTGISGPGIELTGYASGLRDDDWSGVPVDSHNGGYPVRMSGSPAQLVAWVEALGPHDVGSSFVAAPEEGPSGVKVESADVRRAKLLAWAKEQPADARITMEAWDAS